MPNVNLSIGGELLDARLESARLGDHTELRKAAFGEASIGSVGGATLDVGLRGDWSSVVGAFASPSVSAALPIGKRSQLRGSFGRGFRAPNWTERYYRDPANIGDSTLKVETFWSHEIGARATPVSWMSADLAYFERRASSLIDWARPAGSSAATPWHTMNFTSATYRGVEGKISLPALLGVDWVVRGSGLRFDASAAPGTVGKYALRPITSTFGISALTALGSRSTLTIDALRARRAGESNHVQLNGRLVHTIGVMRLSAELMNATNADYLDGSGKPVAPRSAFVGVAWVAP
jgi:iron complex outermembrane receptor protein